MNLFVSLLGTFDVRRDGQPISDFRSQSVRALLAYLAMEANRPHEREHLCALIWPGEPLSTALTNLRQALHRLRQAIEPADEEGRHLLITRQSVQLNQASVHNDVASFQEALSAVATHRHRSAATCATCVGHMRAALGHYRGDLLPGFSFPESDQFEEWLHFTRERLHHQLAGLLDWLSTYHERRGELGPAIELLRRWTQIEPWNEHAHVRLIGTLAQDGQRVLALRQFDRYRTFLAGELSIEPGQVVIELVQQVRSGVLRLPVICTVRHAPTDPTPFVGRDRELARVAELLGDPNCRLLTLTGIGGSGKTRLAIEAARASCHAFSDGALFVSLVTLRQARQLPEALATALGLFGASSRSLLDQVIESLRERELLLILDNCEQVQDLGPLLARLLVDAPKLTVLATSRAALDLRAEWTLPVEGLGLAVPAEMSPDPASYAAGLFFMQVARQVRPRFNPGPAEARLVLECCALLGGTPLGIELAASRLRARRLDEIIAGVRADIDSLATTMGDLAPRHRSLRAVFDWSWRLLSPLEQQALASMSMFSGGCDHAAARAVCGEHAPFNQLVAKSLLHRDEDGRYWMHEQTRQFAEEHLSMHGAADSARRLHGAYYLGLATSHAAQIDGPRASVIVAALKVEYGNLRRAWSWAARSASYELLTEAAPVFRQIYASSDLAEGAVQFRSALAGIEGTSAEALQARRQLLDVLVGQLRATGQTDAALAHARELLDLARASGDPVGEAVAILHLADLATDRGDFARAWGKLSAADGLSAERQARQAQTVNAHALLKQASLIDVQQLPVDDHYAQRAYEIYTALDMPIYAGMALNRLGNHQRRRGDYGRAIDARLKAAALIATQGDLDVSTVVLNDLGEMYLLVGCYQEAHTTFTQALAMARRLGANKSQVIILEGLARSLFHLGDLSSARVHIQDALDVDARRATQMHRGYYLTTLGYIAEREGSWDAAGRHYYEAQRWWDQSSHASDAVAEPRAGLARVALAQRQHQEALEHTEMVLPLLARAPLQDALEPMWVHWSCYQALVAVGDGQAGAVIEQAHTLLRRQAKQISDPYLRGSFLNRVAAHREIVAACKAAG